MKILAHLIRTAATAAAGKGHKMAFTAYQGGARGVCKACRDHVRVESDNMTIFGKAVSDRCKEVQVD